MLYCIRRDRFSIDCILYSFNCKFVLIHLHIELLMTSLKDTRRTKYVVVITVFLLTVFILCYALVCCVNLGNSTTSLHLGDTIVQIKCIVYQLSMDLLEL